MPPQISELLCALHPHQHNSCLQPQITKLLSKRETLLFHLSSPRSSDETRSSAKSVGLAGAWVEPSQNHVSMSVPGFCE